MNKGWFNPSSISVLLILIVIDSVSTYIDQLVRVSAFKAVDVSSSALSLKGAASKGLKIDNSITADGKKIQARSINF